jgi:1,4-dihydroxy-2-naphthoyl-CoA hydrolase
MHLIDPKAFSPFDHLLGVELVEATRERVRARVTLDPARHYQPWGITHGGLWCAMVETVASVGAQLWAEPGQVAVGLENHTSFLRMARSGVVEAEATPVNPGRTSQVWAVHVRDEAQRLLATGTCRLLFIREHGAPEVSRG